MSGGQKNLPGQNDAVVSVWLAAELNLDEILGKILMFLNRLTPAGPGPFAEEELLVKMELDSPRFWPGKFPCPPDNKTGVFE